MQIADSTFVVRSSFFCRGIENLVNVEMKSK